MWFCGLPGSGKSTISKIVFNLLQSKSRYTFSYISMDEIRPKIFPEPKYDDSERDAAYRAFVLLGSNLASNGINVILDGTGHKVVWRNFARSECERFIEIYLRCPIELCIRRETKRMGKGDVRSKLYLDALKRLETGEKIQGLGKMPGVDEPFEESTNPEITVDSSRPPQEVAEDVMSQLSRLAPSIFQKG